MKQGTIAAPGGASPDKRKHKRVQSIGWRNETAQNANSQRLVRIRTKYMQQAGDGSHDRARIENTSTGRLCIMMSANSPLHIFSSFRAGPPQTTLARQDPLDALPYTCTAAWPVHVGHKAKVGVRSLKNRAFPVDTICAAQRFGNTQQIRQRSKVSRAALGLMGAAALRKETGIRPFGAIPVFSLVARTLWNLSGAPKLLPASNMTN